MVNVAIKSELSFGRNLSKSMGLIQTVSYKTLQLMLRTEKMYSSIKQMTSTIYLEHFLLTLSQELLTKLKTLNSKTFSIQRTTSMIMMEQEITGQKGIVLLKLERKSYLT